MPTRIVVLPRFEQIWPLAADHLRDLLEDSDGVELIRTSAVPTPDPAIDRLIWLGGELPESELDGYPELRTLVVSDGYEPTGAAALAADPLTAAAQARGIERVGQPSEGFWAESVSEFAIGLTIAALRSLVPRTLQTSTDPDRAWSYEAEQLSDDLRFTSGTIAGRRIRIVGAGNIASRYASAVSHLGAEVAAWDPFAAEPAFHRSGARRARSLVELVADAEIFVPMVPLTPGTTGLVTADLIDALPLGALVVLATRAGVCDMTALRRRLIGGELALAADVFDVEPLPTNDPLLGLTHVLVTPHIAGRTLDSNESWARALAAQFADVDPTAERSISRIRR